jgi:riboflavin synthase
MFTGIVQARGCIVEAGRGPDGLRLAIAPRGLDISDIGIGDSVAVNGCCLTVVALQEASDGARMLFDVSAETLRCTTGLSAPGDVNLEKALRLADRLGGHLMTGHVDGVGTVVSFAPVAGDKGGSWRLEVEVPGPLARFIATKGSIAVQGVSLTVNGVDGRRFEVNLIPHTLEVTTLGVLRAGSPVNIEVDLVARYVQRLSSAEL